jgi:hypothetical protein
MAAAPRRPATDSAWVGYVSDVDGASEGVGTKLAAGSIRAAVSDGEGSAAAPSPARPLFRLIRI